MPLAETLILTVAPAIAKTVLKLWASDEKLASEGGAAAIDVLAKLIPDLRTRNEADRQLAAIGERAAESLRFIFDTEGKTIFVDDQELVAQLVADTLNRGKFSAELLVRKDLDPSKLAAHFLSEAADQLDRLPPPRAELFRRVIEEASQSIIDIAHELPSFSERTFAELLRQNRVLVDAANRTLDGLERIRSQAQVDREAESAKFETEYRRAVKRNLNRMELFGVDLSQSSKSHPLNVAYVGLAVARSVAVAEDEEEEPVIHNVEFALAQSRRILIKGPAGGGKTTLLRWIAVQAASGTFDDTLKDWNDALPFVIRLREFGSSGFPPPEKFPSLVASTIAGTMPSGWVHQRLKSGNAIVMVDGVDEVAEARRDDVRKWINELTDTFPNARLIVTSRPYAVKEGWLEADGFGEADLQPMDIAGIESFIDHWHKAVAEEVQQEPEVERLTKLSADLKETLRSNRAIRRLATSPLLCGVICALHRDTNEQLPEDRVELYERCCSMLLDRRDPESGLTLTGYPRLTYRQKRALLDDLAYWMIKNEWTEVAAHAARDRFGKKLENLRTDTKDGVAATATNVFAFFLERSGMLRQPVEGKLDFAHRTFQEFMAAQAAVDEGDIGVLVKGARIPQWREVVILGAGLARPRESRELITSLLAEGDKNRKDQYELHLLAAACLDTAVDLDAEVKSEVESRVKRLVPPSTMAEAMLLAEAAGDIAVPFLKRSLNLNAQRTSVCVRTLGLIGSLEALQAIAQYAEDGRVTVLREVAGAADRFDVDSYEQLVLPCLDVSQLSGDAAGKLLSRFDPKKLKGLREVKSLALSNPTADALAILTELPILESLTLTGASVDDLSILRGLNLRALSVRRTRVADLSALRALDKLTQLDLELSADAPDLLPLHALADLAWLRIAVDSDTDLTPLGSMTKLRHLILTGHGIRNLSKVRGLSGLETLQLWDTWITDLSPLTSLGTLNRLILGGMRVKALPQLRSLTSLRTLSLWSTLLQDLSSLKGLTELTSLTLSGTNITNLAPLRGLTNLHSLSLWSTGVKELLPLQELLKLRNLELAYTKADPGEVEALQKTNPELVIRIK